MAMNGSTPPDAAAPPRAIPAARQARAARAGQAQPNRDPVRTRSRLLDAAVAEFAEHGFHGARTDAIARRAGSNIRMLYHYFGSKDELYLAVLEQVLSQLRHEELRIDPAAGRPLDGVLRVFDYVDAHFARHPQLRKLLAFENLNEARHLGRSTRLRALSSPLLETLGGLLARGAAEGCMRPGLDALHVYVAMVSLAYYGRAHAFTLSHLFGQALDGPGWQADHLRQNRAMLEAFLRPGP